jgi:hypothetical protein
LPVASGAAQAAPAGPRRFDPSRRPRRGIHFCADGHARGNCHGRSGPETAIGKHPLAQLRRAARNAAAPSLLLPLYAPAGLLVGIVGGVPFILLRAFPSAIRFSGVSFSYNLAYAVFGGLTPIVIPLALAWDRRAHVCYLLALCALGTAVGIALWRGALPAPMPAKNRS